MTTTKDVELGEDIIDLVVRHPDVFNETDINVLDLDKDTLYLIEKHIGYYAPRKRSGIFIIGIIEITDEYMESCF